MARRFALACGLVIVWMFLAGCNRPARPADSTPAADAYPSPAALALPASPTPAPSPTATVFVLPSPAPTVTPTPALLAATATPACQAGLHFISDLTVPDGTVVAAGDRVDKRWQVENNGTCNWDGRYRLRRISGPDFGLPEDQALYPARASTQVIIRMLLQIPAEPGVYRSAWQAVDPQGQLFGDPIFVEVVVGTSSP
jgi:hypothetical protein